MDRIVGELSLHRDGYGFVIPNEKTSPDIFIPAKFVGNAMHRDTVEVAIVHEKGAKREGRILRVIKRGVSRVIGRFEQAGKQFRVIASEDMRIQHTISIPQDKTCCAKNGDTVVVEVISYPGEKGGFSGVVIKKFGKRGDEKTEVDLALMKHNLPAHFSKRLLEEAERIYKNFSISGALEAREDLRKIPFVTIDGEKARDFDDAIAVEKLQGNLTRLYVSIADVSFFVKEGSILDKEAYSRGTSVYFPDRCLPMLPHQLSDDLCSLKQNEDRLTMTAQMDFLPDGSVKRAKFYRSVIKSRARMTYTDVKKILTDNDPSLREKYKNLVAMLELAEQLFWQINKKRFDRGSIDFDLPEPEIILDIEGGVDSIVKSERNIAHRLIEEFMVSANEAVARFLTDKKAGCIYRIHDGPDPEKMELFKELLYNIGYRFKWQKVITPAMLSQILKQVRSSPQERLINTILLRSMARAVYSPKNVGHFGLASSCYCHFTSPIRRYPDLIVHRILGLLMQGKTKYSSARQQLTEMSEQSSQRERVAMEAEREVVSLYVSLFMKDKVGMIFNGIISSVTKFGFFVELKDYFVEGLVHIDTLLDDKYGFNNHMLIGKKKRKTFKIGDLVKVEVSDVNIERREVNFELVI